MREQYNYYWSNIIESKLITNGPGVLHSVIVNNAGAASNTLTLYDNNANNGTGTIAVIDTTELNGRTLLYDINFDRALLFVTATGTAGDVTVTWGTL